MSHYEQTLPKLNMNSRSFIDASIFRLQFIASFIMYSMFDIYQIDSRSLHNYGTRKSGGFNHFETDWRRLLAHSARTLSSPAVIAVPTKRLWLLSDGVDTPELGQHGRSWKVGNRWSGSGANLFQTPVSLLNWSLYNCLSLSVCVWFPHKWDASIFKVKIVLLKT